MKKKQGSEVKGERLQVFFLCVPHFNGKGKAALETSFLLGEKK